MSESASQQHIASSLLINSVLYCRSYKAVDLVPFSSFWEAFSNKVTRKLHRCVPLECP